METFENGGFRKRWRHSHNKHRGRVYLSHAQMIVVAYSSVLVWTGKTLRKRWCGRGAFDVFSVKTERFENALVWTVPYSLYFMYYDKILNRSTVLVVFQCKPWNSSRCWNQLPLTNAIIFVQNRNKSLAVSKLLWNKPRVCHRLLL